MKCPVCVVHHKGVCFEVEMNHWDIPPGLPAFGGEAHTFDECPNCGRWCYDEAKNESIGLV